MSRSSLLRGLSWVPSLYFIEGLPYIIITTLSVILYSSMGVSNTAVTFYTSLFGIAWIIKPLWSPIVGIVSSRRRWILLTQSLIAVGFLAVGLSLGSAAWLTLSIVAFIFLALISATHDIAADGFYMLGLDQRGQSFFVGLRTLFYRLAMLAGSFLVVKFIAARTAIAGVVQGWSEGFYLIAGVIAVFAIGHLLVLPHPAADITRHALSVRQVFSRFVDTFKSFFLKKHILTALLFMLLYKFPEAQMIKIIPLYLKDTPENGGLGLTLEQYGDVYGLVGLIGMLAAGIIGGILVARHGLRRWMMPMAWSMSATCLTFVWLAYVGEYTLTDIYISVFIEQFGYGFGTTAYMLYLIQFARGENSTAHYAIATGIMSLGMMLPGMGAGLIQETIGYGPFFVWTMVCCIITIAVSYAARRHIS